MDKNKKRVVACVDATIEAVCNSIQGSDLVPESYSDTIKALAQLVEARAVLCNVSKRTKASKAENKPEKPLSSKILIDGKTFSKLLRNP